MFIVKMFRTYKILLRRLQIGLFSFEFLYLKQYSLRELKKKDN